MTPVGMCCFRCCNNLLFHTSPLPPKYCVQMLKASAAPGQPRRASAIAWRWLQLSRHRSSSQSLLRLFRASRSSAKLSDKRPTVTTYRMPACTQWIVAAGLPDVVMKPPAISVEIDTLMVSMDIQETARTKAAARSCAAAAACTRRRTFQKVRGICTAAGVGLGRTRRAQGAATTRFALTVHLPGRAMALVQSGGCACLGCCGVGKKFLGCPNWLRLPRTRRSLGDARLNSKLEHAPWAMEAQQVCLTRHRRSATTAAANDVPTAFRWSVEGSKLSSVKWCKAGGKVWSHLRGTDSARNVCGSLHLAPTPTPNRLGQCAQREPQKATDAHGQGLR